MSAESRWIRKDVDWWEQEWCQCLSEGAQLAWDRLLCRTGSVGQRGVLKKTPVPTLARQWFLGEESVHQMLIAAVKGGVLIDHGDSWEVVDKSIFVKDPTASQRKQAQREREKASQVSRDSRDVTTQDKTVQDGTKERSSIEDPKKPAHVPPPDGFVPPDIEEVLAYASIHFALMPEEQAQKFFFHYDANGWRMGDKDRQMDSWHSALGKWYLTWKSDPKSQQKPPERPPEKFVPKLIEVERPAKRRQRTDGGAAILDQVLGEDQNDGLNRGLRRPS